MKVEIDGTKITSEAAFHRAITSVLDFGYGYGNNLDALRDRLGTDVERPIDLTWRDAAASRSAMPERFDAIVQVLRGIEAKDVSYGWDERFELVLA